MGRRSGWLTSGVYPRVALANPPSLVGKIRIRRRGISQLAALAEEQRVMVTAASAATTQVMAVTPPIAVLLSELPFVRMLAAAPPKLAVISWKS